MHAARLHLASRNASRVAACVPRAISECYFVGDRGKLKISGERGVVLFGKKASRGGEEEEKWTAERYIQSPYFRTNPRRVRFAGFGPSDVYITAALSDFPPSM